MSSDDNFNVMIMIVFVALLAVTSFGIYMDSYTKIEIARLKTECNQ